jgi:signal transduction histidine kinase
MSSFLPQFLVGLTTGISVLTFGLAAAGTWPVHVAWFAAAALLGACLWLRWTGHAGHASPLPSRAMAASELASAEVLKQLREDFLATLSHELRTPLNAMLGWVRLLRLQAPVDPSRALDAIERNAAHQAHLIDDLLDVSHMLRGGLTLSRVPMPFEDAARAAVDEMQPAARQKGVTIILRTPRHASVVDGDFTRLQQAIRNLLSNAVKFTPTGGRVEVCVTRGPRHVQLDVCDSGDGVDASFLPHMFEPFTQGPSRDVRAGLGLGLSIVEAIVAEHGGDVTAHSPGWGRGTVMRMRVPIGSGKPSPRPAASDQTPAPPAPEARVIRNTVPGVGAVLDRPVPGPSGEDRVEAPRPAEGRRRDGDPAAGRPQESRVVEWARWPRQPASQSSWRPARSRHGATRSER